MEPWNVPCAYVRSQSCAGRSSRREARDSLRAHSPAADQGSSMVWFDAIVSRQTPLVPLMGVFVVASVPNEISIRVKPISNLSQKTIRERGGDAPVAKILGCCLDGSAPNVRKK